MRKKSVSPHFSEPRRPRRTRMLTVRLTPEQNDFLAEAARRLRLDVAEIVRQALDLWAQSQSKGNA